MSHSILRTVVCIGVVSSILVQSAAAQMTGNRFSNRFSNEATPSATDNSAPGFVNDVVPDAAAKQVASPPAVASNANTASDSSAEVAEVSGSTRSTRSMLGVLRGAGPMAFPIAGCSLLLVMFTLERAISLRRRRVIPKHFVKLFLSELEGGKLKPVEALEQCEENLSPISEVFAAAVKKWNRPSVEVEQAVIDAGEREANGLRRYLRLFNGIATVSPLLGLLGTVLGMIEAFNAIAASDAMGKPEKLAEGISQALLTTAGGLSVAIPAFIVYMYFTSRVDRLIIEIDSLGQKAVSAIASDAWKGATKSKKAA